MSDRVITTRELSKQYARGWLHRKTFQALKGVDLEVKKGEVFGLLGPNGAGKTTLIKLLLGIIHPTHGTATILGQPAGSRISRQRIGYLPENLVFPRHHTGISALYFYGRLAGLPDKTIRQRSEDLLKLVGLKGRESEIVRKYSKGMRQRLGLAQAMLHEPEILILDEPTDGLDPLGRSQIRELIEKLKGLGKTVFLNSHILQEVEMICDRVGIMAHGELKAIGAIRDLVDEHSLGKSILVEMDVIGSETRCKSIFIGNEIESLEIVDKPPSNSAISDVVNEPIEAASVAESDSETRLVSSQVNNNEKVVRYRVRLRADSQPEIDRWVDQVRQAGISILGMHRHRMRLEDVFLKLVESNSVVS